MAENFVPFDRNLLNAVVVIQTLINLLQVMQQAKNPPAKMVDAFLFAAAVYSLLNHVVLIYPTVPNRFPVVTRHLLACSALSVHFAFLLLLWPEPARPFLFAIFGSILAGEVWYSFGDKLIRIGVQFLQAVVGLAKNIVWGDVVEFFRRIWGIPNPDEV